MKTKSLLEHGNSISATAVDYETAIHHAGQGKFQFGVMAACGLYYIACAFQTFCISYLLPSAECDLRMTSYDKGLLNSSPFIGSLAGACIWGKLADSWGRKSVILTALAIDAVAAILSSFMQSFWPFFLLRLVTGLTNLAAIPVCYPYLGELHSSKYRSRALCWMEMFWALGTVLVPLVAWAIIPRPWLLGSAEIGFRYNSWRIFIAVAALPSVLSISAIYYFPESPAFLLTKGRHDEALEVFKHIYHFNTGRPAHSYPVKRLEMDSSLESKGGWDAEDADQKKESLISRLIGTLSQMADLFRPPLLKNTMIGLLSLFSLQLGYFGFGMWFPELFNRFEEFQIAHPNQTASVCEVVAMEVQTPQWMLDWQNENITNADIDCLDDTIQPQVFINTFSIGSACIICALLTGTFVERIGRKRVIVTAMTLTACCGAGSYFVRSASQNLALSCFLQAFNAASFSTLMSVIIELFPATLRGLATTILMNISYIGSIVGNIVFGALLDVNCAIPVFLSAGVIGGCGILCLFLPNNKNAVIS
ncbi:synaptic vesicle glycoprotein 2B-like isoform X2 [Ischnura elegans]|uniref:synaptic vesicle glycoprotein 2B-like isoform X2 n=1 Tax=Ischnura elegans TaxID=197161 RepID=UPI001ED87CAF|nr:synaptic vesicle glycoprotein 2B-like isoform X2 [Ischnura elegans]